LYASSLGPREEKPAASFFSAFDELYRKEEMADTVNAVYYDSQCVTNVTAL
jgi:hypothetical protein